jgi:FAD/FMN-containing dehydrogenase
VCPAGLKWLSLAERLAPSAPIYISRALENFPSQALVGGHILLWPARGNVSRVSLFMWPTSDFLMGFGTLPAFPKHLVEEPLFYLNMASQGAMMIGGEQYLSGWIKFDATQWKAHYGDLWPTVLALKKKFDPPGVLNPGFVLYE